VETVLNVTGYQAYSKLEMFSGGLPTTAFFPFTTIGRSMSFGFSARAVTTSSSVKVFPLNFSF